MTATTAGALDITDAHQDVIRAAIGSTRFATIKGAALMTCRDVTAAFTAELTDAEKTRIREALDGAPLDHDALSAGLGADRYCEIWQGALMPSTPDRHRDAVVRAALAAYADPITGLGVAELMAPGPAPRFAVGDCHIGDCQRPADHKGRHGQMTKTEAATAAARTPAPAAASDDPFDSDEWRAIAEAAEPAEAPAKPALRVSTRRVPGTGDRDFAYVGLVKLGAALVAECGHEHYNRDQSSGVAGGSAKSCAESILDGARRPATAEHIANRIRTAPAGLRPVAGFIHPAGTIEAAREAAEKNTATYLAAVAAVREHLDTLEEPLPNTHAHTDATQPAPLVCLDAGPGHICTGKVEYRDALSGTGRRFPRCNGAWSARLDLQNRLRRDYPDSATPPGWYTRQGGEAYAGERWDEDY